MNLVKAIGTVYYSSYNKRLVLITVDASEKVLIEPSVNGMQLKGA